MVYTYQTKICMGDTDATGVLYFTNQLRFALEAFECFLSEQGFALGDLLLPIVHAEADYYAPLKLWDTVEVRLYCTKIGMSSFAIESEIGKCGRVQIVHVFTDKNGKKQPINPALKALLLKLKPLSSAYPEMKVAQSSGSDA